MPKAPAATVPGRRTRRKPGPGKPVIRAFAVIATAATLAGCVVVPARPVYYRPVHVRPYAYVVF